MPCCLRCRVQGCVTEPTRLAWFRDSVACFDGLAFITKRKKLLSWSSNKEKLKIEIIEQVTKKADGMLVLFSNASHVYAPLMWSSGFDGLAFNCKAYAAFELMKLFEKDSSNCRQNWKIFILSCDPCFRRIWDSSDNGLQFIQRTLSGLFQQQNLFTHILDFFEYPFFSSMINFFAKSRSCEQGNSIAGFGARLTVYEQPFSFTNKVNSFELSCACRMATISLTLI